MKNSVGSTLFQVLVFAAVLTSCAGTGTASQSPDGRTTAGTSSRSAKPKITSLQQAAARAGEGNTHYENREWLDAVDNYTDAIEYIKSLTAPEGSHGQYLVRWYSARAMAWKHEGDLEKARADVDNARAVKENPQFTNWIGANLQMLYVLASCRIYGEQQDYASAIREMTEYIEKNSIDNFSGPYPDIDYSYYYRGVFYYRAGDYEKAAEDFDTAVGKSSYHYDEIDDRERPWEIMSAASVKARGANSYVLVIRDTDTPANLEINQRIFNDTGRKDNALRRSLKDRELIILPGRYEIKAPDRSGLIMTGSRRVSETEIEQTYRETIRSGQVFFESYEFLPGVVYNVTPWEITIVQDIP
ncbi:tetratricopeptide repeat protein [Breznakiella homolactica]|uniref:Tetratricopeptide repeat protein n=1 Tax=Breznakiella homolactica TaxID=2798577 RepID=A0A7T7XJX5_9SPIR|nr:tetratricopeptide repeat protein [Breznakiella homolactica]QQO07613.1 tetratricopeptide repeat protein [Breznakiella homolactica]